jgi:transcriptional regulator with PAS, ATPase and Fis domain
LRKEIAEKSRFRNMVSRSPKMQEIFDLLPEMAQTPATVLITGESGTGKELIARSLHELGARSGKPFVAINCGALPDNLLESELFGYKAGAFTDAKKDKPGKFAAAQGGTMFLDEIGDISPALQVKLLRVLQERVYEPLGGVAPVKAEARVVAATNRDLAAMVKAGRFREDLFYRIRVLTVKLPPLRERRCDVPVLCDHFISVLNARYRRQVKGISDDGLGALLSYSFPGNIRELENIIEHAFIFCKCDTIDAQHLPAEVTGAAPAGPAPAGGDLDGARTLEDVERIFLKRMIAECGGNKLKTAQRLGIHKTTLFRKLRQLEMEE